MHRAFSVGGTGKPEKIVAAYHERTKHYYHRFAASSGYMDWATQPNPFRRYDGTPLVRLPLPQVERTLPYWKLYVADSMEPAPLSIDSVFERADAWLFDARFNR